MQRGYDSVSINGKPLTYQGLGRLKDGMTVPAAADATKENGFDEILVSVVGPNGASERLLIYANKLDFSFSKQNQVPDLRINGQPAVVLHYEDEPNGFWERASRGVGLGFKEAFESVSTMAKRSVEGIAITGSLAVAGTTAAIAMRGGAGTLSIISQIAKFVASNVVFIGAGVVCIGATLIAVSGIFRAIANGPAQPKMGTIAAVIDDDPIKGLHGLGAFSRSEHGSGLPVGRTPGGATRPHPVSPSAPVVGGSLRDRLNALAGEMPPGSLQGFGARTRSEATPLPGREGSVSSPRLNLNAFKDLYKP